MEFIIYNHTRTSKGIDINKATLEVNNEGSYKDYDIRHLTDKGYYSKKALYVDFDYEVFDDGGMECLRISEAVAERLLKDYTGLQGKIFQTAQQRYYTDKAEGMKAICSVMHDPYDIG
jgi:hypothetical protein